MTDSTSKKIMYVSAFALLCVIGYALGTIFQTIPKVVNSRQTPTKEVTVLPMEGLKPSPYPSATPKADTVVEFTDPRTGQEFSRDLFAGNAAATQDAKTIPLQDPRLGDISIEEFLNPTGANNTKPNRYLAAPPAAGDPRIKTITPPDSSFMDDESPMVIDLPESAMAGGDSKKAGIWYRGKQYPLPPAPNATLVEKSKYGDLPKISETGEKPWDYYKANIPLDLDRPKLAIIVGGLGLDARITRRALEILPPSVTLGFVPYADNLQQWVDMARQKGHEVILEVPLEPLDYPRKDVGKKVLLSTLTDEQNQKRLEWMMGRMTGYSGMMNYLGNKFLADPQKADFLMQQMNKRGLYFIENRGQVFGSITQSARSRKVPYGSAQMVIDNQQEKTAILKQMNTALTKLENQPGIIAVGYATETTLQSLEIWFTSMQNKFVQLAPVSAVLKQ